MTRSTNHPDADYTPSDIGPNDRSNGPEKWKEFEDVERSEEYWKEREKLQDATNDLIV